MSDFYDQIALALHVQLMSAGPDEDHECSLVRTGVFRSIESMRALFAARDQLQRVLGGEPEFDADRFIQLATKGKV